MIIGVPKEVKSQEFRVGLLPFAVRELVESGHEVYVQTDAGCEIGECDDQYVAVGAKILPDAASVFERADMIVKVKEPQKQEIKMIRENQLLFTYLHLAPDPEQTKGLVDSNCIAIAYETITDNHGGLPLLAPMSEVAGRLATQQACWAIEKHQGGSGILLGAVPGVEPAHVLVIGGGVVGTSALRMAIGLGARVTVLDKNLNRLRELNFHYAGRLNTVYSTREALEKYTREADIVIGAVLVPGAATPKIITRDILRNMKDGTVLVDVAIDQGGIAETSRPTTHENPLYTEEGVVHYCVANMPSAVARTSAYALNNATLPFVLDLANKGYRQALKDDGHLLNGLNICQGHVTYDAVAKALGYEYVPANQFL